MPDYPPPSPAMLLMRLPRTDLIARYQQLAKVKAGTMVSDHAPLMTSEQLTAAILDAGS